MRVEEKFNKRDAKLLEVQQPTVDAGAHVALGVRIRLFQIHGATDRRSLSAHLTPDEALTLARDLIDAAQRSRQ